MMDAERVSPATMIRSERACSELSVDGAAEGARPEAPDDDDDASLAKGQGGQGDPHGHKRRLEAVAADGAAPGPPEPNTSEVAEGSGHGAVSCTFGGLPFVESLVMQAQTAVTSQAAGDHVIEFTLGLPFLTHLNSQLALQYLNLGAQAHRGLVRLEFAMSGSDLLVRLHCADADLLQVSATTLLSQLTCMVRTMQHLMPRVHGRPWPGTGT